MVMTMTMMMILPKITNLVFDLTMTKFGCSRIENLCLVAFSLDKQADFHGSKGPSSVGQSQVSEQLIQLNSALSLQTSP